MKRTRRGAPCRCLAFSGNSERVWAGSDDGYVRQFVVSTGELVLRFSGAAASPAYMMWPSRRNSTY